MLSSGQISSQSAYSLAHEVLEACDGSTVVVTVNKGDESRQGGWLRDWPKVVSAKMCE